MPHTVSDRFRAEVARSGHTAVAGCDLVAADGSLTPLRLTGGQVTEDATAAERWTLDLPLADDGAFTPLGPDSLLVPGAVLQPWRGLAYADGTVEQVPLGVYLAGQPEADTDGTLTVKADGRSTTIGLNRLVTPWPVPAGSSLAAVVSDLLADRLPGCPAVRLDCADVTLAATFIPAGADSDPWQALVSDAEDTPGLVRAAGRRLEFDDTGVPVLRDLAPAPASVTIDGATLVLSGRTTIDASTTYGGVCVTSAALGDDTPLQAVRWDPDPAVPVLARRVYFAQLDALTTQEAVDAAAESLLARVTGIRAQVSWTQPPDPSLRAGDQVTVDGGPIPGTYEVAKVVTPLVSGVQQVEAVERTWTS